jgi:hypothetical protein
MELSSLIRHPASVSSPVIEVDAVALVLATNAISFRYRVRGDIRQLRIPAKGPSLRADQLWRHTCFEAFLKPSAAGRYVELNFAPSSAWAAYSFDSYRLGMQPLAAIKAPSFQTRASRDELTLEATLQMRSLRFDSAIGLSAVIEDLNGAMSYWALAHPGPKPDFHDASAWTGAFRRFTAEDRP